MLVVFAEIVPVVAVVLVVVVPAVVSVTVPAPAENLVTLVVAVVVD